MTIHSFRRVLKVRRHVHAIPWNPGKSLVLPIPVPLLGLAYFAALELAFLVISRLPIVGLLSHLPFYIWWVIPFWLTYLALTSSFDGRMPHLWVRSWITFRLRPKHTRAGVRITEPETRVRWRIRWWMDEHSPRLHRARITGPARVWFNVPVRFSLGLVHRSLQVQENGSALPQTRVHEIGERLEVRG